MAGLRVGAEESERHRCGEVVNSVFVLMLHVETPAAREDVSAAGVGRRPRLQHLHKSPSQVQYDTLCVSGSRGKRRLQAG